MEYPRVAPGIVRLCCRQEERKERDQVSLIILCICLSSWLDHETHRFVSGRVSVMESSEARGETFESISGLMTITRERHSAQPSLPSDPTGKKHDVGASETLLLPTIHGVSVDCSRHSDWLPL